MDSVYVVEPLGPGITVDNFVDFIDLNDLKKKLKESGMEKVHLQSLSQYDDKNTVRSNLPVEELDQNHINWVNKDITFERRYFVLIKSKTNSNTVQQKNKTKRVMEDVRIVGTTSENIFLSLLNQQGVFATSFDTLAFDGIVFDIERRYYGISPSYVQIKCRGSINSSYSTQGHSKKDIDKIKNQAIKLGINKESVHFVVGFFINSDIRTLTFYSFPIKELGHFMNGTNQYRFSVKKCDVAIKSIPGSFKL